MVHVEDFSHCYFYWWQIRGIEGGGGRDLRALGRIARPDFQEFLGMGLAPNGTKGSICEHV